jgi:hypothetical protein
VCNGPQPVKRVLTSSSTNFAVGHFRWISTFPVNSKTLCPTLLHVADVSGAHMRQSCVSSHWVWNSNSVRIDSWYLSKASCRTHGLDTCGRLGASRQLGAGYSACQIETSGSDGLIHYRNAHNGSLPVNDEVAVASLRTSSAFGASQLEVSFAFNFSSSSGVLVRSCSAWIPPSRSISSFSRA